VTWPVIDKGRRRKGEKGGEGEGGKGDMGPGDKGPGKEDSFYSVRAEDNIFLPFVCILQFVEDYKYTFVRW